MGNKQGESTRLPIAYFCESFQATTQESTAQVKFSRFPELRRDQAVRLTWTECGGGEILQTENSRDTH